jgi:serine/threonine-protein kinase
LNGEGSPRPSDPPEPAPDRSDGFGEHEPIAGSPHAGPATAPHPSPARVEQVVSLERDAEVQTPLSEGGAGKFPGHFPIPGYQILGTLSEGSMGRVYRARQTSLDRIVAIKVLDPLLAKDVEYHMRFVREAKLSSRLSHPNLIATIDAGEGDGHPYYVMEYIEGETIEDYLARHQVFDETTAIRVILCVAEAMEYIHARGLIHRDIKPANVILTREGGVKLADLGLARSTADAELVAAEVGWVIGTPEYISPEQIRGHVVADIRGDIYSLGATLYRMVTGRVPYGGATSPEVWRKHLDKDTSLVPPERINPALSRGTSALILRMLAREREERYRDPAELILGLRGLLSETPG